MSAQIIPFSRAQNGREQSPPRPSPQPTIRAWLIGAARRYWRRVRGLVEAFGWIVVAASIFAAMKG